MPTTLDQYIDLNPAVRGGKSRIAGTRITVADIAMMHLRLDNSLEQIAAKYDLPLAAVYAAMAYYHEHRLEIDRRTEEGESWAEALRRSHPSLLQAKLKALKGG